MAALTAAAVALAAAGVPQSVGVASAMGTSAVPRHWHAPRAWLVGALCIHRHEGAWNANTGNGYYGGMQFDLRTWASVGGVIRPDLAEPREQLFRAYSLWRTNGWRQPWPRTSRACNLR